MHKHVYLLISDISLRKGRRTIRVFRSLRKAVAAKNEYLRQLTRKFPKNEIAVVNSLAREFVARFRAFMPDRRAMHGHPRYLDDISQKRCCLQVILRIESGILMQNLIKAEDEDDPIEEDPIDDDPIDDDPIDDDPIDEDPTEDDPLDDDLLDELVDGDDDDLFDDDPDNP
jgi:hypothetical protein